VNHPNLSPEINAALQSLDGMVGLFLYDLPAEHIAEIKTRNSTYRLSSEGRVLGGKYDSWGVAGSTFGGSMIRMGWVGVGMYLEIHRGQEIVTTTVIQEVNILKPDG